MARIIPLPAARRLDGAMEIMLPVRSNIPDYGPPGWHLHPPVAFTQRFAPRPGQRGGLDQAVDFPPGDIPPRDLGRPLGAPLAAAAACDLNGGVVQFNATFDPAANEFHGFRSRRFPGPFVIPAVGHISTVARNANIVFLLETDDEEDTTTITGNIFPRQGLAARLSDGQFIFPTTTWEHFYPNFMEPSPGRFIKLWLFNNSAAAVTVDVAVSVLLL